jgi:uncharacterized protein YaiE (UPF0345 family)
VGDYEFHARQFETVTVVSGELTVLLPNSEKWQSFGRSESFTIEANQKFKVQVKSDTTYLCTYG